MPTADGPPADIAVVDPPSHVGNPAALGDPTPVPPPAWRPWKRGLAVCLLYTTAAVFFTWPLAPHLATHTFNHIDPPFSAWRMAWVSHQLLNDPARLFEANIFWPARRTLAYSDAIPLQGVLAVPMLGAGLSPIEVANLFTIFGVAASAAAAYVLARRLTGHTAGAVLAGFVFAFSPYFHDHLVHLELVWAMFAPLAFWAWHRALDRGGFRDGFLCVIFLLLQLLSSIYYGMFLAISLAVLGVTTLAARRFRLAWPALSGAVVASVLLAVVATEYSRPYQRARMQVGERNSSETLRYSAPPSAFVTTRPDNLLYGPTTGEWHEQEKRLMPGVTPVVLAATALAAAIGGGARLWRPDAVHGRRGAGAARPSLSLVTPHLGLPRVAGAGAVRRTRSTVAGDARRDGVREAGTALAEARPVAHRWRVCAGDRGVCRCATLADGNADRAAARLQMDCRHAAERSRDP